MSAVLRLAAKHDQLAAHLRSLHDIEEDLVEFPKWAGEVPFSIAQIGFEGQMPKGLAEALIRTQLLTMRLRTIELEREIEGMRKSLNCRGAG